MNKIGLYFGTFNPIHKGHLALGNYFAEHTDLDQVWFVVSPQNPFKVKDSLLEDQHRLELVRLALKDQPNLNVNDVEFSDFCPTIIFISSLLVLSVFNFLAL